MRLTAEDIKRAQAEAKRQGIGIGAALIKLGLVSEEELCGLLAEQYGVPAVDLKTRTISAGAARLISREDALRLLSLPIERIGSVLIVATADPSNYYAQEAIERITGFDVEFLVCSEPAIRAAIEREYSP